MLRSYTIVGGSLHFYFPSWLSLAQSYAIADKLGCASTQNASASFFREVL